MRRDLLLLAVALAWLGSEAQGAKAPIDVAIESMYRGIFELQWNDSVPVNLPWQAGHDKGKFQTDIHFNFAGNTTLQLLRSVGVPDNNMFVSSFVLESVLEALLFSSDLVEPMDDRVQLVMEAIVELKDKNRSPREPIFGFWPQVWTNGSTPNMSGSFEQWPINLAGGAQNAVNILEWVRTMLIDVNERSLWESFGPMLIGEMEGVQQMMEIPSDADDTSVILALQRFAPVLCRTLPKSCATWKTARYDFGLAFETIRKHSYCPYDSNADEGKRLIDPRTYYWMHEYLQAKSNSTETSTKCFVATWLQNLSTSIDVMMGNISAPTMPLNVNNVDPTVCSNALYAMSAHLLYDDSNATSEWFNQEMRALYLSTADLVAYALGRQMNETRPDLEMLYYPPKYNLNFFAARHLRMLETYLIENEVKAFPYHEMEVVRSKLSVALRGGEGLAFLTNSHRSQECMHGGSNSTTMRCWDGFLGHADTDDNGTATPHYEDRFFSTAVAANALLDAFTTIPNSSSSTVLVWLPGTPLDVVSLVTGAAEYLIAASSEPSTSYLNSFFSGSFKYWEQKPFWYPANKRYNMLDGSQVNCSNITMAEVDMNFPFYVFGVEGVMPTTEFDRLVREGCAKIPTPTWFTGYNGEHAYPNGNEGKGWPFWSSVALSKSFALRALSKYRSLQ